MNGQHRKSYNVQKQRHVQCVTRTSIRLVLFNRTRVNVEVSSNPFDSEEKKSNDRSNLGEELLRKIRERHAKKAAKESDEVPGTSSTTTHLLVTPV